MEESSAPDSKRRRTSCDINSITQLPHDYLSAIADYLPTTSRILLSMALSPADSFTTDGMSEASKAIISSNQSGWEKLNFSDHPDLTDKDLHQLLVLIDAKNTLKVLKLNDCHILLDMVWNLYVNLLFWRVSILMKKVVFVSQLLSPY